jgi:hypothetical protein
MSNNTVYTKEALESMKDQAVGIPVKNVRGEVIGKVAGVELKDGKATVTCELDDGTIFSSLVVVSDIR